MTPDRQFKRTGMSPFLSELSGGLFDRIAEVETDSFQSYQTRSESYGPPPVKKKVKKLDMADFSVGLRVSHPFFGPGVVTKLSKTRSLDIHFDRHGLKTLHLDYAKLTIV